MTAQKPLEVLEDEHPEIPEHIKELRAKLLPAQQVFCDGVLRGLTYSEAFRRAYPECPSPDGKDGWLYAGAWHVSRGVKVSRYLDAVRRWLASQAILSAEEMLLFCQRTLRTKQSDLFDEDGLLREVNSDLVQEYDVHDEFEPGTGRLIGRKIKVKMMPKKDAMAIACTLQQFLPDRTDEGVESSLAEKLRPTLALPTGEAD